nr:PREDICTED: uncharacterized protein LOC109042038 [Bemisia tabaci]
MCLLNLFSALYVLFSFASLLIFTVGVQITDLRVPAFVENGTRPGALLDCEYSLRPDELNKEAGLVVKWFFNNSAAPVYQWIPGKKPQDLGILKGRLRLDYASSEHRATKHRALYILNPTTELSGEYKCQVSTFDDEDFMVKKMLVFATGKPFDLSLNKYGSESVNISCKALGVYPEPKMTLFTESGTKTRAPVKGASVETLVRGAVYDIMASTVLPEAELTTSTVIVCELKIPATNVTRRQTVSYNPGSMESLSSSSGTHKEMLHVRYLIVGFLVALLLREAAPAPC